MCVVFLETYLEIVKTYAAPTGNGKLGEWFGSIASKNKATLEALGVTYRNVPKPFANLEGNVD